MRAGGAAAGRPARRTPSTTSRRIDGDAALRDRRRRVRERSSTCARSRAVRGVEVAGLTSRTAAARAGRVGRVRAGSARRGCSRACARWRATSTSSRSSTPTSCASTVMEEIAAAVRDGAQLQGPDLREAARAQPRRSAPRDRARERDRRADRVLREPDPHEDAPAARARSSPSRPPRWGRSRWCARRRSTAARTAAGSGIPRCRAAACSPTWAATASRSAGTCSPRPVARSRSSSRRRVLADVGLLKWGQPRWRDELLRTPRRRLLASRRPRTSPPAS